MSQVPQDRDLNRSRCHRRDPCRFDNSGSLMDSAKWYVYTHTAKWYI